jgi:hypothetical protein
MMLERTFLIQFTHFLEELRLEQLRNKIFSSVR